MRVSSPSALIRTSEIQEALFRFSRGVASRMRYKLVAHRVGLCEFKRTSSEHSPRTLGTYPFC
jgi:hypothetical protein